MQTSNNLDKTALDLDSRLQKVGKKFFVEYFLRLHDASITNTKIVDFLTAHKNYSPTSCLTRVKKARSLLKKYPAIDLLDNVINSKRMDADIIKKARKYRKNFNDATTTSTNSSVEYLANTNSAISSKGKKKIKRKRLSRAERLQYIKKRSLSLLPNVFTLFGLFFGFLSIVLSMRNDHMTAMYCIAMAGLFDGLDGKIARLTNSFSRLGVELDSIADMVSFGIAPSIFLLSGGLDSFGNIGWSICFLYVATAALRLARFNVMAQTDNKSAFLGLPSPAAAGIVVLSFIMFEYLQFPLDAHWRLVLSAVITVLVSLSMVSLLPYASLKLIVAPIRPFWTSVIIVFLLSLIIIEPLVVPSVILLIYWLISPIVWLIKYTKSKFRQQL